MYKLRKGYEFLFAFLLAQSSEFAFVLVAFAEQKSLFNEYTSSLILLVATLSMTISPLLLMLNEKAVSPILTRWQNKLEYDDLIEEENPVIIAGFGRFGLVIGRMLQANNFNVTIIDSNPRNVETLRKFGFKLYYGDVTRPATLEKAGIHKARLLILSMAEYDEALEVAKLVSEKYPKVKILARAKDIYHAFEFFELNVHSVQLELSNSAAELGARALAFLGLNRYEAYKASRTFKHHDEEVLMELFKHWKEDPNRFIEEARRFSEELNETLKAEKNYSIHDTDYAWDLEKKQP
jgi:voltage-gated potassium channel Kch